jgi:hypothetical protein
MSTARLPIDAAHRAASSDAHAIGAVTGLTDALAGKAAVAHVSAVTGIHGIVRCGATAAGVGLGLSAAASASAHDTLVAVGYQAATTSVGANNTAVGFNALKNAADATDCTALGWFALATNVSGAYNTAFGGATLNSCTGIGNTGVGRHALYAIANANHNVGIGLYAGRFLADGSTANATSANSTYIGTGTRASAAGATNETAIGYSAIGGGSNTVRFGNASVVAWLPGATNKVAIGSSTLAFKQLYMTDGTNNWKLTVDATGPVWTSI